MLPFVEWFENEMEFTLEEYSELEMMEKVALSEEEAAMELLPDYPTYEIDGELYYYVDPSEFDEEISEEKQAEIDEMKEKATEVSFEQAAQMLLDGDFAYEDTL